MSFRKNVLKTNEITRVISTSRGLNGVRMAYHVSVESTVTNLFYCSSRNRDKQGTFKKSFKKNLGQFLF